MDKPNGLDWKSLQVQLENYKLILDVNTDWIDESILAREELAEKLELAQSYLNESHQWGEEGDQTKSYDALRNVKIVIMEVGAVIRHLLYQDSFLAESHLNLGQISA